MCARRGCPSVSCTHPALDGCACGVCDGCIFYGRSCSSGEQFPNPVDRCQLCSCLVLTHTFSLQINSSAVSFKLYLFQSKHMIISRL